MWISKRYSVAEKSAAEAGTVTIAGSTSLEASSTVRAGEVLNYSPYGYSASVPRGEEILLLNGSSGAVSAGTRMKDSGLDAGEVALSSVGGAKIILKNDGSVEINGVVITKDGSIISTDGEVVE